MADQDWKHGGLNRGKYIIVKPWPKRSWCQETQIEWFRTVNHLGPHLAEAARDQADTVSIWGARACPPEAQYFVLRIDCPDGKPADPHARKALECYADSVEQDNPQFAADIRKWLKETDGHET